MLVRSSQLLLALTAVTSTLAFVPSNPTTFVRTSSVAVEAAPQVNDAGLAAEILRSVNYKAGGADTEFARRYRHLAGAKVKTVGEAFAEFTSELGFAVNALYKNMVTDLVGTLHLIVVNARFERDAVWSFGLLSTLDLLLKNYPEPDVREKIISSLFKCTGLKESEIRAEAKSIETWAQGKSRADVEAALRGEGDSPIAAIANSIKGNDFWMYSRYFGLGLLKVMDIVGIEMDKDEVYPILEDWMKNQLGRSSLTACADSDLFFRVKDKLDMMETLMKEIEIREKKRLAERLELKAEEALRLAEKESQMQAEIEADSEKMRDKVA